MIRELTHPGSPCRGQESSGNTRFDFGQRMPTVITADELIGLNREIAALVRAGVPLEEGLQRVAAGAGRGETGLALRLSDRLSRGESLSAAFDAEGPGVPRAYRAIVEAGQRSGRLPEALEAVANLAESLSELRRRTRLALIYPALVAAIAFVLCLYFATELAPRIIRFAGDLRLPIGRLLTLLSALHGTAGTWGWAVPAVVVALIVVARMVGRRGSDAGAAGFDGGLSWWPGMSGVRQDLQRSHFSQLLADLVEHQTPLPEALELAGDAVGTERLSASAHRLANQLRSGQPLSTGLNLDPEFSPLQRWLMTSNALGSDLATALRRGGELLRARAERRMALVQKLLPVVAVTVIGGGAVLVYGLAVFGPLSELLDRLTWEPFH